MTASADSASADSPVAGTGPLASPAATWLAVGTVVLCHVALLVAAPDGIAPVTLLAVEASVLAVAVAVERLLGDCDRDVVGVLAFAWVLLAGGTFLATRVVQLWVVALALGCVVALVAYALHRVELVALGLVEVADERE
jgi:hypothetical protein